MAGRLPVPGAELPAVAREVLTRAEESPSPRCGWSPHPAPLAAVARGTVTDGWLGVTAVTVDERHRRRGLAAAVMAALQVVAHNAPALAPYRRAGFIEHHRYHYRCRPA